MPNLEITETVLVRFKIVNNNHQQDSGVLYTLIFKKSIGQLIDIFPENFIFLKTFNSELSEYGTMVNWSKFQTAKAGR